MIGYYVHHVGAGHVTRAAAIARHLRSEVTVLGSGPFTALSPTTPSVLLDRDDSAARVHDPTARGVLHWAPLHDRGFRRRMTRLSAWVETAQPRFVVVDVSVEVAVYLRLLGVPVVVAAMRGDRLDRPHRAAYDLAEALLAPWPARLGVGSWEESWTRKAWHVGAFSRYDGWPVPVPDLPSRGRPDGEQRRVHVLWGAGGPGPSRGDLDAAQRATPGWRWTDSGLTTRHTPGQIWAALHDADVVVTHGGQNAVAEVAAARRPAVVVAQPRPHDEQLDTATTLDAAGIAVARRRWPATEQWPELLDRALDRGGSGWSRWSDGHGASRAAARLDDLHRYFRGDRRADDDTGGAAASAPPS